MIDWALAFVCAALVAAAVVGMVYIAIPILTTMVHYA